MSSKMIFGFGSLISKSSLLTTAPHATNIHAAYIRGFRRDFSLWDPIGYTETNLDLAGIPFTGLDIRKTNNSNDRVNGVIFTVSGQDLDRLLIREQEYELIETPVFEYESNQHIDTCSVFSSGRKNASFDFDSAPLRRYVHDFLAAAQAYGERYYQEILATTFIGDEPLSKFPKLIATAK